MKPLVSIVIPVWNQEKYVAEAIDSVLGQSYPKIELIVVDDGSTDKTSEIVKSYGSKLIYIRQKNKGAATALNVGTKRAKGTLVGWLSSDDVYFKRKIEEQVKYFEKYPEVSLVYTDFQMIDGDGKITSTVRSPYYSDRKEFIRQMIMGNFVNGSSILAKKKDLLRAGLFDPKMKYHADGDMWFRILKFGSFGHISKVLLKYRWHSGNASHDTKGMMEYLKIYYSKVLDLYKPTDLYDDDEMTSNKKFHMLFGRAYESNHLFKEALHQYINGNANFEKYVGLINSVVTSTIQRTRRSLRSLYV